MMPDALRGEIKEMETVKEVIISRGPWPEMKRDEAFEILFEDGSDNPYVLHIGKEQIDRLPAKTDDGKKIVFAI